MDENFDFIEQNSFFVFYFGKIEIFLDDYFCSILKNGQDNEKINRVYFERITKKNLW